MFPLRLRFPLLARAALATLAFVGSVARPGKAGAWEGHDWEEWRAATGALPPALDTPQAGRADLVPLLEADEPGAPAIDSIGGWETKRDRVLGTLRAILGEPTALAEPPPVEVRTGEEFRSETHIRRKLLVRSEADDWIPAWLLIPLPAPALPRPTAIVLHQTVAQGKDEPCGVAGRAPNDPDMAIALELVERGWVCVAPDAIGFGERIPEDAQPYATAREFHRRHPRWSFFGKMAWDVSRVVDALATVPESDPARVAVVGHSHGAYGAMVAAALEPRVSAVVANNGFSPLRADPHPERWSHLTALAPALGFFVGDPKSAPIDWHEILACIAPRPFFHRATSEDANFPTPDAFPPIFRDLESVYGLHGAAEWLAHRVDPGPHGFPSEARGDAYAWLDEVLPPRPPEAGPATSLREWAEIRPAVEATIRRDLGPIDPPEGFQGRWEWLPEIERREGYSRRMVRYGAHDGESISAHVLLPDGAENASASFPGVVVFHGTVEIGKDEAVGMGRPARAFGAELAMRGWVVLAPDSVAAGERVTASGPYDTRDFYRSHPTGSAMGKMILDGRRALDVLAAIPAVDPARLAAVGHSLGAQEALFLAAFDERVVAAVGSCGWEPIAGDANPWRWARDRWFSYLPRLRIDLRAGRLPAWDFDDVVRLTAPRAYFNFQTDADEIFPGGAAAGPAVESARNLWTERGADDRLKNAVAPGPHDFPEAARTEAWDWLEAMARGGGR